MKSRFSTFNISSDKNQQSRIFDLNPKYQRLDSSLRKYTCKTICNAWYNINGSSTTPAPDVCAKKTADITVPCTRDFFDPQKHQCFPVSTVKSRKSSVKFNRPNTSANNKAIPAEKQQVFQLYRWKCIVGKWSCKKMYTMESITSWSKHEVFLFFPRSRLNGNVTEIPARQVTIFE